MKIKDRSTIVFDGIKGVLLTLLSVLCVLPFIVIISGSFTSNSAIIHDGFSIFPREFTLEAYNTIFKNPQDIVQAYKMNIYYTFMDTALGLLVITLTAYVISRKEFKYRKGQYPGCGKGGGRVDCDSLQRPQQLSGGASQDA